MIYAKNPTLRRTTTRRATTVPELAMVLPIVLVFLFGTLDFAQVMYAYGTVSEAARVGARYAMVHGYNSAAPVGPTANDATVASTVQTAALALNASQLTITSSWGAGDNAAGSPVTVTASYKVYLSVAGLVGLGSSVTVSGTTTMLITH
jgi:Flp pilus assembly protein TadG